MYKLFLDNHRNGVMILDKDFKVCYSNKILQQVFKKDSGERCGEFLECFNQNLEKKRCLETSRCSGCNIRKNIKRVLDGELDDIYIENVMYEAFIYKQKKEICIGIEIKKINKMANVFVAIEFFKVKMDEKLLISDERIMDEILDNIGDYIFYKDTSLKYIYANKAFCNFIGLKKIDLIGKEDKDLFPKYMSEEWKKIDDYVLENGKYSGESKFNGRYYKINKERVKIDKGNLLACVIKDITYEKNEMKKVYIDKLTEVGNRHGYDEKIREIFEKKNRSYDLILLDLDHLRDLNNNFGHSTGDKALKYVAKTLKSEGLTDIYRIGGDEFAILTDNTEDSFEVCNRINLKIKKMVLDGKKISVSMGLVRLKYEESILTNFNYADRALYESKEKGRGIVTKIKR
ncbi:diguanylate cyclase [uncultured Cetobacterium sp.]|uniref:diguanylate cyclase n=1 Tax=uncultured Cetobacterium sp. TaxID=527638 RepID=UPI002622E821|nr:diguanylate cyclase [uncultured Cetobacterium sp.]